MPILSQVLGPNGSGIHQQVLSNVISTQLVPATVHVPSDRVGAICFSIEITTLQPPDPHLVSFVTATITNYLLCCAIVFRSVDPHDRSGRSQLLRR
jgi:hypothetical protein